MESKLFLSTPYNSTKADEEARSAGSSGHAWALGL